MILQMQNFQLEFENDQKHKFLCPTKKIVEHRIFIIVLKFVLAIYVTIKLIEDDFTWNKLENNVWSSMELNKVSNIIFELLECL